MLASCGKVAFSPCFSLFLQCSQVPFGTKRSQVRILLPRLERKSFDCLTLSYLAMFASAAFFLAVKCVITHFRPLNWGLGRRFTVSKSLLPRLRLHKPSGKAIVSLSGKMHYLGTYGSQASKAEYDRLVSEWLARNRRPPPTANVNGTPEKRIIKELIAAYWTFAKQYYRKDGKPTGECGPLRSVLKLLKRMYGETPIEEFSPLKLKSLREHFIRERGWARSTINMQTQRIVRVFRWGVENEMVSYGIPAALREVRGLASGRSEAREPAPVLPVEAATVEATLGLANNLLAHLFQHYTIMSRRKFSSSS